MAMWAIAVGKDFGDVKVRRGSEGASAGGRQTDVVRKTDSIAHGVPLSGSLRRFSRAC
jgi:hypothetical protein